MYTAQEEVLLEQIKKNAVLRDRILSEETVEPKRKSVESNGDWSNTVLVIAGVACLGFVFVPSLNQRMDAWVGAPQSNQTSQTSQSPSPIPSAIQVSQRSQIPNIGHSPSTPAQTSPAPAPRSSTKQAIAEAVIRYARAKNWRIRLSDTQNKRENIFYVTGMTEDGKLQRPENSFYDLRMLLRVYGDGKVEISGMWPATTNPGNYYKQNPMNSKGWAEVIPDQYLGAWRLGYHKEAKYGKSHPALVQVAPIAVTRNGQGRDVGLFGINQHGPWARNDSLSKENSVEQNSAGCFTCQKMSHQMEFIGLLRKDADAANPAYRFDTGIILGKELMPYMKPR